MNYNIVTLSEKSIQAKTACDCALLAFTDLL